jgi:hypothetical protein
MQEKIRRKEYDLVVYGSFKRSRDFFDDLVFPVYGSDPSRLWLIDGEDSFNGWAWRVMNGKVRRNATVFIREMPPWINL